ncbi:hypothetical protein [Leptothermofonsia sp. ETS-13]|uniref:hypothetical protein n=1 Tax=Leptothermofonsia sp. ETS-13 TaxID=3035696 RepID=UPI003B9FECD1
MLRFLATVLLTLICLVSCHADRSIPDGVTAELEPVSAVLTSRQVQSSAPFIWWEAETPTKTNFPSPDRNPFSPANEKESEVLSAGQWIGIDGQYDAPPFLEYTVQVPSAGSYFFYSRKFWQHGPFRWRWDDQPWQEVGAKPYLMDEVAMRQFVGANWVSLGKVELAAGSHRFRVELTRDKGAAAFDCFMLTKTLFQPRGKLKPDQRYAAKNLSGWFIFDPEVDSFQASALDLRSLNESFAGENGRIRVKGEKFVHERNGQPVRFWAVNTSMQSIQMDRTLMEYMARSLAKRGVNMVRLHGEIWSKDFRKIDPADIDRLFAFVAAMKQEGIYTCLSIYFPLWLELDQADGFAGYSKQHPFSLLFFNQDFQKIYYDWWRSLLTKVNPYTGQTLAADPAVAMVELVNEDSYLFWTFEPYKTIPEAQMEILEKQFGTWLTDKYGSLDQALRTWSTSPGKNNPKPPQADQPQSGRISFLKLYDVFSNPDSLRAQDTATFLTESQKQFFQEASRRLRQDFKYQGLIYASNWVTADSHILGPLDKYSNTVADLMDRHGYFGSPHKGERSAYALSRGDTYYDRSALLFTSFDREQEHNFSLPIMDIRYNGMPSIITEINANMPNRFRADFPLLASAYGLLQGSDGFFFFVMGYSWDASLGKFAIASPVTLGQFPALAWMYRKGLLAEGRDVIDVTLKLDDLYALRGAPVTAPQNLDEFRAKDIPAGQVLQSDRASSIDPLAFLVGKVNLRFSKDKASASQVELSSFIDRKAKTVRSSTGQLSWDYRKGLVTVNAPQAQGATGFLKQAGSLQLSDITLNSGLDYGTILLVALDDQPITQSRRMLLQVMSEEQNFGWRTTGSSQKTIESVGNPPILVRNLSGRISLKRNDAGSLTVKALDANGYSVTNVGNAAQFDLRPNAFYYLIEK